ASKSWISLQNFLKDTDLSDYLNRGQSDSRYLKLNFGSEQTIVGDVKFSKSPTIPDGSLPQDAANMQNLALSSNNAREEAKTWVSNQGYLKAQDLQDETLFPKGLLPVLQDATNTHGYLWSSDVLNTHFASKSWTNNQGFLKQADLSSYLTQTQSDSRYLKLNFGSEQTIVGDVKFSKSPTIPDGSLPQDAANMQNLALS